MPDTLVDFSEAMGLIPDNTSRLIAPDDHRSVSLSLLQDRGSCYGDPAAGPWVVPITAIDSWVDIPLAIAGDMVESSMVLFWRMDSNGALFYDYASDWPTVTVPPGHIRAVQLLGVVDFDPNGDTWEFAFTIGGVIQEPVFTIETAGQTDAVVATVLSGDPVDVSAAPPVSMSVRNRSGADDLVLNLVSLRATGGPLA